MAHTKSSYEAIQTYRKQCITGKDKFVHGLPKLELHLHIEGTMTPELRWKLSHRNGIPLLKPDGQGHYETLAELKESYELPKPPASSHDEGYLSFFELFDIGLQVLQKEEDFYELAMAYFERCAEMNVRYTEPFFGPHNHRHRGIPMSTFMNGYRRAQLDAERKLNVRCQWIMAIARSKPIEEAWDNYNNVALPYRDMIVGIGLAANEYDRPPSLFEDLFLQARADGFRLTVHCDVDQKNTHEHIRQVASTVGKSGADRCDHGLNAVEKPELISLLKEKNIGLTLCPWGYITHHPEREVFGAIRDLFDAGVKVTINSDDPPYMLDNWTEQNLVLTKLGCGFSDEQIVQLQRNSIAISWASEEVKTELFGEIKSYCIDQDM